MTVEFDHVIVAVADPEMAAAALLSDHGLRAVAGGRHDGHGTGNSIVPLGDTYLELMTVVDPEEAAGSPMGRWLTARIAGPAAPVAVCLRTDDIDAAAARYRSSPTPMTRTRTDGVVLAWRLVGLDRMLDDGLPFFIQWDVAPGDHPGRTQVEHLTKPYGIDWVEVGGNQRDLAALLEDDDLDIRPVGGDPGVRRVGIATAAGPIILGG